MSNVKRITARWRTGGIRHPPLSPYLGSLLPILSKDLLENGQYIGFGIEVWLKDFADLNASIGPDVQVNVFATPEPLSHALFLALERGEPSMGLRGVDRLLVVMNHGQSKDKYQSTAARNLEQG